MTKTSTFFLGIDLALVGWFVGFDWRIGIAIACLVPARALTLAAVEWMFPRLHAAPARAISRGED